VYPSLPQHVETAVSAYLAAVRARFGPRLRQVRLFGSFSRGQARPDSDVDLLVVIDDLTWREAVDAIDLGTEIELQSGVLLSPIPRATGDFERLLRIGTAFARDLERDGVPL
jgi:predicted nucleotidyltransferase